MKKTKRIHADTPYRAVMNLTHGEHKMIEEARALPQNQKYLTFTAFVRAAIYEKCLREAELSEKLHRKAALLATMYTTEERLYVDATQTKRCKND